MRASSSRPDALSTWRLPHIAWLFVTSWYLFFGIFLVPYRLIRRGQRKRKREALQHRETLAAITHRDER